MRRMGTVMARGVRSGRVFRGLLFLGAAGLVLAGSVISGCGSLSVEEVKAQTLALPKSAPLLEGLRTGRLPGTDEPWIASFLPAASPGAPSVVDGAGVAGGGRGPLVFVHGTPDGMGAWSGVLFGEEGLAGEEDIYTVEVVGHGMLGVDGGEVTFQRCADHVAGTIRALGLQGVTLVGNSYGGEFCWRAALDHPDLISKLVLIDSSGLPRTREQFLSEEIKMREWSVARLGYLVNSEPRVASALDPHFEGGADPERVKEVFLGLENRGNWNAMIDLVRDENGARAGELSGMKAPTLLLWGELDQAYPPDTFGATFAERIPAARLVVIPGAGHYPHEQTPALVAEAIRTFHRQGLASVGR